MPKSIVDNSIEFNDAQWAISLLKIDVKGQKYKLFMEGETSNNMTVFSIQFSNRTGAWEIYANEDRMLKSKDEVERKHIFEDFILEDKVKTKTWLASKEAVLVFVLNYMNKGRVESISRGMPTVTTMQNIDVSAKTEFELISKILSTAAINMPCASSDDFLTLSGLQDHIGPVARTPQIPSCLLL